MPDPINTERVPTLIEKINAGTATRCDIDDVFGLTRSGDKAMAAYNGSADAAEYLNDYQFAQWEVDDVQRKLGEAKIALINPDLNNRITRTCTAQTLGRAWLMALLDTLT